MKRIFLSALMGVGMTAAIFQVSSGTSAARTPEDYPLVCRGGGGLVIGIAPGERNFGFTFTRGTKPAREGLAPGECSWEDRGMYANEPDRVSQHVEADSESLKGGKLAPENRWYEELHSADKYWTFLVSNNGRGQLIATSARPNRAMDVSPTARVPSGIGQILRPDLPKARTPDDETPKMIVLNNPEDPSSRPKLESLPFERDINFPPAPRALSMEEKMGLLKSAGLKTLDEKPTPYVTLTPQQPWVAGRGVLFFDFPNLVHPDENLAVFIYSPDYSAPPSRLRVGLNFETKGIYLMTFTVDDGGPSTGYPVPEFVFTARDPLTGKDDGTIQQTFLATQELQHLYVIVEVAKPGKYDFILKAKGNKNPRHWWFYSCDVTLWKK